MLRINDVSNVNEINGEGFILVNKLDPTLIEPNFTRFDISEGIPPVNEFEFAASKVNEVRDPIVLGRVPFKRLLFT